MPGHDYTPFATIGAEPDQYCVFTSASKAFNIAGLQCANIFVDDEKDYALVNRAINIHEVCDLNPFGPVALIAAYNESEEWIDELNQYLWGNYVALCQFASEHLPQWKVCRLEGTYLPWVDISALGISAQSYCDRVMSEAKVWINPGTMYGPLTGEGYIRLNIACPRSRLMEALQRIANSQHSV
jgi:cystathionine beta-lyase